VELVPHPIKKPAVSRAATLMVVRNIFPIIAEERLPAQPGVFSVTLKWASNPQYVEESS
jgi:hypothetical protein